MRVLVIKLTSMGDLMHALPALTDATTVYPDISFDWVVDESFAEVPAWHPAVDSIYKSAHRRWRKKFWRALAGGEFTDFYRQLNANDYDVIIDAQNNVKSAFISWLRRGRIHGMDKNSVAEQPAWVAYANRIAVDRKLHAITRQRQLFASALGYPVPQTDPDFGLKPGAFRLPEMDVPAEYLFFVHNASWTTKLWPESSWHELIVRASESGFHVLLPGGNDEELQRAKILAQAHGNAVALPKLSLTETGGLIERAAGAVCCDTGLAHLAAMTGTPAVTLYGPTSSTLIGTTGKNQQQVIASDPPFPCAPCYKRICDFDGQRKAMASCMQSFSAERVWRELEAIMMKRR